MAVAVVQDFPGATTDQYDEAIAVMGLASGAPHPGALFHWIAKTDSGIRVTDVWETREQFERFAEEKIRPAAARVDFPEPETQFVEVHNYMAP